MARPGLTEETLQQMLDRQRSATHGPWRSFVEGRDHESGNSFIRSGQRDLYLSFHNDLGPAVGAADLDFVAHAHRDVDLLIREVRRLRAVLADESVREASRAELEARPCVMCGFEAYLDGSCERCGRNLIDPDYHDAIEMLAQQITVDAFDEEPNLRQVCDEGSDLDRSIVNLADRLRQYHWDGDGCFDH